MIRQPLPRGPAARAAPFREPHPYFERFNRRFGLMLRWLAMAYPAIFLVVVVTQHVTPTMGALHLTMYGIVLAFFWATGLRDAMAAFIATFSFWFYSFMLFLYALIHWKSPEDDLYAPWLSSVIALIVLVVPIASYGLAKLITSLVGLKMPKRLPTASQRRSTGVGIIIVSLPFLLLPLLARENGLLNAFAGIFQSLLWVGVIIYCVGRGPRAIFATPVLAVAAATVISGIGLNARGPLLSLGLVAVVLYFAMAEHPLRPMRLVGMFFAVNAVSAVSSVMIAAREMAGHEGAVPIAIRAFTSANFLLAIMGLRSSVDSSLVLRDELKRHDDFLIYMFDGRLGLFERVTHLPSMDIVVSKLPLNPAIDWGEVKNTFLVALPSIFGQTKELDYADRIVWDLGLMSKQVVGHPMITAAAEAYTMGGFWVLVVGFLGVFTALFLLYEISKRVFVDRFVAAAALLVYAIYLVFSSSAMQALSVPTRVYPITLVLYPIIAISWGRLVATYKRATPKPVAPQTAS